MSRISTSLRRALYEFRLRRRFSRSVIHGGATVDGDSSLGDYAVLFRNARLICSTLGSYSYVQENTLLLGAEVGPFCSIAANVTIGLVNHPTSLVSTSPVFYDRSQPLPRFFASQNAAQESIPRTVVGADVWIGERAMIRAGVSIGVGAVIGAGAMVTRDVPPYTIAAGVPCRPLRQRFDATLCGGLADSEWWTLSEQRLSELAPYFASPEVFLTMLRKQE